MHLFKLIYRSYRYKFLWTFNSNSYQASCGRVVNYNGGLVIWRPCGVGGSNPTVDTIFCNVHLFRVPRSWTDNVQIKSSMTFIRGIRCVKREKDYFKSREVKRLKECALALTKVFCHLWNYGDVINFYDEMPCLLGICGFLNYHFLVYT